MIDIIWIRGCEFLERIRFPVEVGFLERIRFPVEVGRSEKSKKFKIQMPTPPRFVKVA
jgi:hypothetical protein